MTSFGYNTLGFGSFTSRGSPVEASGGTTATASGFKYHKFTSAGTFSVSAGGEVEYLVVAGGGGGGDSGYGAGDGWGKGGGGG
jgi:hypothetical protein